MLPFGRYMSIFLFILAINWILEGDFKRKLEILKARPYILFFASVPFLLAAGYLYSEDKIIALLRIKISLPLFVLPVIIGSSKGIPVKFIRLLLSVFVYAVSVAAILGLASFYFFNDNVEIVPCRYVYLLAVNTDNLVRFGCVFR